MSSSVEVFMSTGLLVGVQPLERPRCPELCSAIHVPERSWSLPLRWHTNVHIDLLALECIVSLITCGTHLNSRFVVCSMMAMITQSSDLRTGLGPSRQLHLGALVHHERRVSAVQ